MTNTLTENLNKVLQKRTGVITDRSAYFTVFNFSNKQIKTTADVVYIT